MLPGFREEMESRQQVQEELNATRRERDALVERLRRLEAERETSRDSSRV
jgi:predicted nuclease with TOPRIM domain